MSHSQLTLALGTVASFTFDSYMPGAGNAEAYTTLHALCAGDIDEKQIYLWGNTAVGKTHLLSAACQNLSQRGFQAAYLTGEIASYDGALTSMESADLLCIDDVHTLEPHAQEPLFHCINRCRESGTRLLFSSSTPVDKLEFSLPDLVTRLSWGPVFQLQTLSDDELPNALALQLKQRDLEVGDGVIEYIVRRYPRDMHALAELVEKLDDASMREQRRVTIPLVKSIN